MILTCNECGQKNRVPANRLHESAKCGKCTNPLGPMASPIDVGSVEQFDDIVQNAAVPVLVDFWAPWCGPCRMAAPQVEKTAADRAGRALVLKVNTDELPQLGARYNVQGIPNFVVFGAGGQLAHQQPGLVDANTMQRWLDGA